MRPTLGEASERVAESELGLRALSAGLGKQCTLVPGAVVGITNAHFGDCCVNATITSLMPFFRTVLEVASAVPMT